MIDALVDGQFDAAMRIGDIIQDFEDHLFDRGYREQNKSLGFDLRKCLLQMRRFAALMREVVGRLLRETPLVSPDLAPYFEDVQDHTVTITEAGDVGYSWRRWPLGSSRASADRIARSAQDSFGVPAWRWSTATWWRRMRISASLARSDRASKASQPNTRSTAR